MHLERSEALLPNGDGHPEIRASVAAARDAFEALNIASSGGRARRAAALVNRSLSASLEAQLAAVTPPHSRSLAELAGALLDLATAASSEEVDLVRGADDTRLKSPSAEEFTLARCASLAASIAVRREERAEILQRSGLDEDGWSAISHHWDGAIARELRDRKNDLLRDYDEAYVAQLEAERGPIDVEQFVKLSTAQERGLDREVLAELRIPRAALPRVKRVFMRRLANDRALARRLRAAMS
jgi:hypothetical protein